MAESDRTTRETILVRSASLFGYEGKEGVSMRDIAREVGVTISALYYHFPDKQALYLSAVVHAFAEKMTGGNAALYSTGAPRERLTRFVEWMAKLLFETIYLLACFTGSYWTVMRNDYGRSPKTYSVSPLRTQPRLYVKSRRTKMPTYWLSHLCLWCSAMSNCGPFTTSWHHQVLPEMILRTSQTT